MPTLPAYSGLTGGPSSFNMPGLGSVPLEYSMSQSVIPSTGHVGGGSYQSRIPADLVAQMYKQQRFDTVWPWMQNNLKGLLSNSPYTIGGQVGGGPTINTGGVWNPQQTQQNINAMRDQSTQATQGAINQMRTSMAGRGFGANSPLAQAMTNQYQMQNYGQQMGNERDIRMNMAQKNAEMTAKQQGLQEQQWEAGQGFQIERQKPYFQILGSLLGSLGGLV